jgi:hypothetical protein
LILAGVSTPEVPADAVAQLLARQQIHEVVLSYCRAIDRLDFELLRECYHQDAIDHHTGFDGDREAYIDWVQGPLSQLAGTQHTVANHLVELHLDRGLAYAETYCQAYHWTAPGGEARLNFTSGSRYVDRFEYRAGRWRIAERWSVREWTRLVPEELRVDKEGPGPEPMRSRADLAYRR